MKGKLYLIPVTLGDCNHTEVLPSHIKNVIDTVDYYIVENEKTARKSIKTISPGKIQSEINIFVLNKHTDVNEYKEFLKPLAEGKDVGLLSEAGCPCIADPGAIIVNLAHERGIRVLPLVGPSSILLALMASGMNGQNFAFNGYLPIDINEKKTALRNFEQISKEKNQSQIFIETPYRNNKLFEDTLNILNQETKLCIAADISLPTEYISTKKIADWKKVKLDLKNRPTIFIIHK